MNRTHQAGKTSFGNLAALFVVLDAPLAGCAQEPLTSLPPLMTLNICAAASLTEASGPIRDQIAGLPIAVVRSSAHAKLAQSLIDLALSPAGQDALVERNFLPADQT